MPKLDKPNGDARGRLPRRRGRVAAAAEPPFAVVAIAASAGGLAALSEVLGGLPADFPAAVVVVQHVSPDRPSHLVALLAARTALRVQAAADGEPLAAGVVFVAPPDHHLSIDRDDRMRLDQTPRLHFVRPSAGVLLASLAASGRGRVIAVILTGRGADGAAELAAVRTAGGVVLAQDEATSEATGMPVAAVRSGAVSRVLPLRDIAPALAALVRGP